MKPVQRPFISLRIDGIEPTPSGRSAHAALRDQAAGENHVRTGGKKEASSC